jgi:hypothetical protein
MFSCIYDFLMNHYLISIAIFTALLLILVERIDAFVFSSYHKELESYMKEQEIERNRTK